MKKEKVAEWLAAYGWAIFVIIAVAAIFFALGASYNPEPPEEPLWIEADICTAWNISGGEVREINLLIFSEQMRANGASGVGYFFSDGEDEEGRFIMRYEAAVRGSIQGEFFDINGTCSEYDTRNRRS